MFSFLLSQVQNFLSLFESITTIGGRSSQKCGRSWEPQIGQATLFHPYADLLNDEEVQTGNDETSYGTPDVVMPP